MMLSPGSPSAAARARRAAPALALLALALLPAAALASDEDDVPQPLDVVAELAVDAPALEEFVLHGTFPVPPGTFVDGDGPLPFMVRDTDGRLQPAQVETVSRYARGERGAEVVEVLARVHRPADTLPGQRLRYDVVWSPHERREHELRPHVEQFLAAPHDLVVLAHDAFGHAYSADLLTDVRHHTVELRTSRDGWVTRTQRTHQWMRPQVPEPGPYGTYDHFFGVHAYVHTWRDEDFVTVDLRVHNGASGNDPDDPRDDPIGTVYFRELELRVPAGWKVVTADPDPALGDAYLKSGWRFLPLVSREPGGKFHVMPTQAQFVRRVALVPVGADETRARAFLEEQGHAFVREHVEPDGRQLWSWWNRDTARYWAQNEPLPRGAHYNLGQLQGWLEDNFQNHHVGMQEGAVGPYPVVYPSLGWAHPWGPIIGYMHGGNEIHYWDGVRTALTASTSGYRLHQLTHRMLTSRMPDALYDVDGDANALESWLVETDSGPVLPVWMYLKPVLFLGDPFGFLDAPKFQHDYVKMFHQDADYAELLEQFQAIDIQHMVRYSRVLKTLIWLGNDALAKDDLRMQAELMRTSYNLYPQTESGSAIVTGMLADRRHVDLHPGEGLGITRGEGWIMDTMAAAYAIGDDRWRTRDLPWFRRMVNLMEDGQADCTGVIGAVPNLYWFGGQYRLRQSISEAILLYGLWSARQSVFAGADPEYVQRSEAIVASSAYGLIDDDYWDEEAHAPYFLAATGPFDTDEAPFCAFVPHDGIAETDNYQTWTPLVLGYRVTGNASFLFRLFQLAQADPSHEAYSTTMGELENRVSFATLLEDLGLDE